MIAMMIALAVAVPAAAAKKDSKTQDVDTEDLFGFTQGSDIGDKDEKEAESETTGRFGKRDGAYAALSQRFEAKVTPLQDFRFGIAGSLAYHGISGVTGLDDREQVSFQGLSLDIRRRLLDLKNAPFGLTIVAEPHWARVDYITGEPVDNYGAKFLLAVDKELVSKRLYAAFNLQ
jgi:hypothetical protein